MATRVEDAMAEVQAELGVFAPERDGLAKLEQIDVSPALHKYVKSERVTYDRRIELEQAFLTAAKALLADGYPGLPPVAIDAAAYSEMAVEVSDIEAALKKFTPNALATLGLTAGAVVPKA